MAERQTLTFRNELNDLDLYLKFYAQTPEGRRYGRSIFLFYQIIALALVALVLALFLAGGLSLRASASIAGLTLLFLIFLTFLQSKFQPFVYYALQGMRSSLRHWSGREREVFLLPKVCEIAPEGFRIQHALAEHFWKWEAVDRLVLLPGAFFIQIGNNVFPFPRRLFESQEHFETFVQAARQFYQAALPEGKAFVDALHFSPTLGWGKRLLGLVLFVVFLCLAFAGAVILVQGEMP